MFDTSETASDKKLICFIDDSAEERELFAKVFGCDEGAFRVLIAETLVEAKALIGDAEEIPRLFVLDLYFPGGGEVETAADDLNEAVVFHDDEGDLIKAYMNLEIARKRYQGIRIAMDQSPSGGLKLIAQVQEAYPGVPIVTYTRKGTVEEAETARRTGARRVLQKPSGDDWDDTLKLTIQRRVELERAFLQTMLQDPYEVLNLIAHYAELFTSEYETALICQKVSSLRDKLQKQLGYEISSGDVDDLMENTLHPFIRALIYQLRG